MAETFQYCPLSRALRKAKFGRGAHHILIDKTVTRLENTRKAFGDDQYTHTAAYRHGVLLLEEVTGGKWDRETEKLSVNPATAKPKERLEPPVKTPEELAADRERLSKLKPEGPLAQWDPNGDRNVAAMVPPPKVRLL